MYVLYHYTQIISRTDMFNFQESNVFNFQLVFLRVCDISGIDVKVHKLAQLSRLPKTRELFHYECSIVKLVPTFKGPEFPHLRIAVTIGPTLESAICAL